MHNSLKKETADLQHVAGLLFTELLRLVHHSLLQFCSQQHCRCFVTTACSRSVPNGTVAVLSQQFAADLTTVGSRHVTTGRNMPPNASDMRPVDGLPQQADKRPAKTSANLAVYPIFRPCGGSFICRKAFIN